MGCLFIVRLPPWGLRISYCARISASEGPSICSQWHLGREKVESQCEYIVFPLSRPKCPLFTNARPCLPAPRLFSDSACGKRNCGLPIPAFLHRYIHIGSTEQVVAALIYGILDG